MTAEVTSELQVYMRHLRAAKICARGARTWFPKQGFPYQDFLDNGISAELLTATGDPFALRAVEQARIERDG
jgi:hypothetical protein